jgi:outer membrane lipoprotein-sorting protein
MKSEFLKSICMMSYVLCFIAALTPLAQGEPTPTDLVEKVQQRYDQTQSLKAHFSQETRSQAARLGTSARGTLYLRRPKAMRWNYVEPRQWFLVIDDKTYHYSPEANTVYEQTIALPEVFNLFSGLERVKETFNIARLPDSPGPPTRQMLELLPRDPEFPVARVILWIEPHSHLVVRVKTEDPLGNINEITLSRIELDSVLDPSLFQLKIPEGAKLERLDFPSP